MRALAGYMGKENTASVLLEKLCKEEGLNVGFYTGATTIHEEKLHIRKVVGDIEELLVETDALDLPWMLD